MYVYNEISRQMIVCCQDEQQYLEFRLYKLKMKTPCRLLEK